MKSLLIYTNPAGEFSEENKTLVKIHIDNGKSLGVETVLYTNFPYEYGGVSSTIIDCIDLPWDRTSNKVFVIKDLLDKGLIGNFWYHDFDAFQNEYFDINEPLALTGYGYKDQINGGSFFFDESAKEFFDVWCKRILQKRRTRADEKALTDMVREGLPHKLLNITYNFGQRSPDLCYDQADKPLKVLHFHPHYRYWKAKHENLDIFMYGKNRQGIPMMSPRLIEIFHKHGIK
jgi:hypothetical protein